MQVRICHLSAKNYRFPDNLPRGPAPPADRLSHIIWFLRNLADANYGMVRGCAIFHPPRFLQTIRLWSLPVLVLVLSST